MTCDIGHSSESADFWWTPVTDCASAIAFWWQAILRTIMNHGRELTIAAGKTDLWMTTGGGAQHALPEVPAVWHPLLFRTACRLGGGRATYDSHGKCRWQRVAGALREVIARWQAVPLLGEIHTEIGQWHFVWSVTCDAPHRKVTISFKSVTPHEIVYSRFSSLG